MQKSIFSMCFLLITVLLISCKKGDTGPAGPAGPQGAAGPTGAQGPQGTAGNANVTQYNFAGINFATVSSTNLMVTTTEDTANRSAWFVYLIRAAGGVYPLPGLGVNGTTDYRMYWQWSTGKVYFNILRMSGVGEEYANERVIRVYANTVTTGGRIALPDIDFKDYYAVCRYYNLPAD